jgi:predicted metal-dependent enzyme (double-stranded beta helix superfamily)
METLTTNLNNTLENIKNKSLSYDEVSEILFSFDFQDYNEIFKINELNIPEKTYRRLPVFNNENCVAILMLWGINNKTAVHDHKNYEGKIKVLKGELTEVYYKETKNFIEYEGAGVAMEGLIFEEEMGGIHSMVNNKSTLSVSLHIYKTSQINLSGVRIFDIENKKWAVLTDKAPSCSWNLPEEAFEKIVNLKTQTPQ